MLCPARPDFAAVDAGLVRAGPEIIAKLLCILGQCQRIYFISHYYY